jgi:hypothetical protein
MYAYYREINLRASCFKNKQEGYILSNVHISPTDGSFEEGGKVVMPPVMKDYTVSILMFAFVYAHVSAASISCHQTVKIFLSLIPPHIC